MFVFIIIEILKVVNIVLTGLITIAKLAFLFINFIFFNIYIFYYLLFYLRFVNSFFLDLVLYIVVIIPPLAYIELTAVYGGLLVFRKRHMTFG